MEVWKIAVLAAAAFLALIILLLFVLALAVDKIAFGNRCDKNPLLRYFTADDFNLAAEPVSVTSGKTVLRGFIYRKNPDKSKLVIFCHGMGAGHLAYTTEINYLCRCGYTVLAVDYFGCNLSDGKNLKGIYSGVLGVKAAIDFAREREDLKGLDIYLVGHSWGGYSALCASKERKVCGVVAIGAPDTPTKTVSGGAARFISKPFAALLRPYLFLINLFKFGCRGNSSAAQCARKNGVPTLLIHGDSDKIVNEANSAFGKAKGENITKYLAAGKGHNPYNTVEAETKLGELAEKLMKQSGDEEFFRTFDFKAATQEDGEVMKVISDFLSLNR